MSEPVIIAPTCNILCAAEVPTVTCSTATRFEITLNAFTQPAVGGSAVIQVCNSAQYAIGSYVNMNGPGYLEIIARPNATSLSVQNNGTTGNAAPTTAYAAGIAFINVGAPEASRWLEVNETWDPGNILDGAFESEDVTATGAALGDFVLASFSLDIQDMILSCAVTAADTVTCILHNETGGALDLGSGTLRVRVMPI